MDMYEMKQFKNGFMAINENLTDIAKSLRKISESLLEIKTCGVDVRSSNDSVCWIPLTGSIENVPENKDEWVLVRLENSEGNEYEHPYIARYDKDVKQWSFLGFNDFILHADADSDFSDKVIFWRPIL